MTITINQNQFMAVFNKIIEEERDQFIEKAAQEYKKQLRATLAKLAVDATRQYNISDDGRNLIITIRG